MFTRDATIAVLNDLISQMDKALELTANDLVDRCRYTGVSTAHIDPTGTGPTRWTMRWKPALNAVAITFRNRYPVAETY